MSLTSVLKGVNILLVLILIVGVVIGVYKFTRSSFFNVQKIEVVGSINSNKENVKKELMRLLGKNIFDVENIQIVKSDPWVSKCLVVKRYPSTLEVKIYEKKSLFKYSYQGKCFYYLSDFTKIKDDCKDVKVFIKSNIEKIDLQEFSKIYESIDKNYIYKLYPSYFEVMIKDKPVKGYYKKESFVKNFNYLINILDKFYKDFDYADIRLKNKIYISGVRSES
ncbi:FtsQ-type POTRA domain-containing protein [Deferribacter thermophilus]|uniref:cell division protein FtsQ/DivIB n=1 Tax=Deferribacter thermophilus TaxID=53573 RepID=UPI003C257AD3